MAFRRISLKKELVDEIEKYIDENPGHGYRSIAQFIEDAARRRAEALGFFPSIQKEDTEQPLQG